MRRRAQITMLVTLALALLTAGPAQGAITVANTNDNGPGSLRQALLEAPGGETINLPAGTYTLVGGPLKIDRSVTIAGHATGDTIIRNGAPESSLAAIGASDLLDVTLRDLTLRDGVATTFPFAAAIFAGDTDLVLERVLITGNLAEGSGAAGSEGATVQGGIVQVNGGSLRLIDSDIVGNTVRANGGAEKKGGVVQGGVLLALANVSAQGSTISGNLIEARGGTEPANPSQAGGVIQGGVLLGGEGEPPQPQSYSNLTIANNVIDASGGPGGPSGTIQGGVWILSTDEASATVTNTTIAFNTARAIGPPGGPVQGGAVIATGEKDFPITFLHSTIAATRSETANPISGGGNILAGQNIRFGATIVADGQGPPGSGNCVFDSTDPTISLGFNLESTDQCGFHANGDKINTAPVLGPLADNGGPVPTLAISPQSQALDGGAALGVATDARGVLQPIDFPTIPNSAAPGADGSDIGAYELQPASTIQLGKLKKNKKKGTASLLVTVPQPSVGSIVLFGKGLKTQTKAVTGQARFSLKVIAKGKVKKKLRKKGKRKVQFTVTYAPTGNAAATQTRKAKLIKKKKKKKRSRKEGKKK